MNKVSVAPIASPAFPRSAPESAADAVRPERARSLRSNALWTVIGSSAYAATQWIQVALVAHLGTSRDVGYFALAMGLCAPVFMLFNLQLRQIQATDAARLHGFGDYLGLRLVSSLTALVALIIIAIFYGHSQSAVLLVISVAAFKWIESISDIYQGRMQQRERMDHVGRSFVLKSFLVLLAFTPVYGLTRNLIWATAASASAQLASLLFYDIPLSFPKNLPAHEMAVSAANVPLHWPRFDRPSLQALGLRALPLGIAMMLLSLYANVPRFVLQKYVGASGVGVFAAITYLSSVGALVVNAVGTSVCARLSAYARHDRPAFRDLLRRLVLLSTIVGILGVAVSLLFGRPLIQLLYGKEYAAQSGAFVWSMIAATFGYATSILGFAATALGRFHGQPWAVGIATVVLLGASPVLVPHFGVAGAAMATVAASFTCLCAYSLIVFWRTNERS